MMMFKMPGDQLALNENALVIGRYGPAVELKNHLPTVNAGIKEVKVKSFDPVTADTSRVTLTVKENRKLEGHNYDTAVPKFVYRPVVLLGDKAFGLPNNLLVKDVSTPKQNNTNLAKVSLGNGAHSENKEEGIEAVTLELTFEAPNSLIRSNNGAATVKEVFYGDEFSKGVSISLGNEDFTATELITLSSFGDSSTFAVRGTNFNKQKVISVFVGAGEFTTLNDSLTVLSPTLLTFKTKPAVFKGVKNLIVTQKAPSSSEGASVVLALASPPPLPKPVITKVDPVKEGDVTTIKFSGSNLNSIESGVFEETDLKPDPTENGKAMTIVLPSNLVNKAGKKDLHFTLKNGTDFSYTLTVEKN